MIKKYINKQNGASLVELMVAAVIAVIVLGGSIYVFTTQQSLLKDQDDNTKVRAKGRLAIKILAREIRMAGFGMPPGEGISNISGPANSIQYKTNLDTDVVEVRTFLDSSGAYVGAPAGQDTINVRNGANFQEDDKVVIFNPNNKDSEELVVDSSSATDIIFTGNLVNSYMFGENANVIYVNKYSDITIALSGDQITKQWDGGTVVTIIDNIAASGLEFEFLDQNDAETTVLSEIRSIGITLNMLDPDNADAVIEFKTEVLD